MLNKNIIFEHYLFLEYSQNIIQEPHQQYFICIGHDRRVLIKNADKNSLLTR